MKTTKQKTNFVIIDGPPPVDRICKIDPWVPGVIEVYSLLWQSAYLDHRKDKDQTLEWESRRDCGGTSEWSIKGLADKLHLGHNKVEKAVNALLRHGFIRILGFIPTSKGKKKRVFQVIHPIQIEAVKHSIEIMGEPFGLYPYETQVNNQEGLQGIDYTLQDFLETITC